MIGIATDSNAQLPPELVDRYGIEVVPLTVTVDGREHLEGLGLDADAFYAHFTDDHRPEVGTSQPSPGQFAVAYEDLIARGCTEILSIHLSAALSGTLNSARLAAHSTAIPVRVVDSGTASFGIGCCVWAAAEAVAHGATLDQAAQVAEQLAPTIGNVFVVGVTQFLRDGGRGGGATDGPGLAVLTLRDGEVQVLARCDTMLDTVHAMAAYALGWGEHLFVAVGHSDASSLPIADALADAVGAAANVSEVVRYRVGPSVGVHTGPGTAGLFVFSAGITAR